MDLARQDDVKELEQVAAWLRTQAQSLPALLSATATTGLSTAATTTAATTTARPITPLDTRPTNGSGVGGFAEVRGAGSGCGSGNGTHGC